MLLNDVRQEILQECFLLAVADDADGGKESVSRAVCVFGRKRDVFIPRQRRAGRSRRRSPPFCGAGRNLRNQRAAKPRRSERIRNKDREQGRCILPVQIPSMESALVTMRKQK